MRVLDLYCGAGGSAMGLHRAGFEVVGVDNRPQPRYPFEFHQADALEFPLDGFDLIHASPPCQGFSTTQALHQDRERVNLIAPTRERLQDAGAPYVIENVVGAPLIDPIMLCGSSFGLRIRRHRLFESNLPIVGKPCEHKWQNDSKIYTKCRYHGGRYTVQSGVISVFGSGGETLLGHVEIDEWRKQMGIDWMSKRELAQAIPPAYTEWIGRQIATLLA